MQLVLNQVLRFALLAVPAAIACSVNETNRTKLVIDLSTLSVATLLMYLANRKKVLAATHPAPSVRSPSPQAPSTRP